MKTTEFEVATYDGDLSDLEDRLDLIKASYLEEPYRGSGIPLARHLAYGEQEAYDLEEVKQDILATARRGVNVAPFIESRPLVPLFEVAGVPLPPDLRVDVERFRYDFYLLEAVFSIKLQPQLGISSAQFNLELFDDITDPKRGVRPVRIFPGRKDVELFKADLAGSIGIDASVNLTVPQESQNILPFAAASMVTKAKLGIVVGPYEFAFRKAALEVKGEGDPSVSWSYHLKSTLSGQNDFKSILVVKIDSCAKQLEALATLSVIPYKRSWMLFQKVLPTFVRRRRIPIELAPRNEGIMDGGLS